MALAFDRFARDGIEEHARNLGTPIEGIVGQAAIYFLEATGENRAARRIPRFARWRRKRTFAEAEVEVRLVLQEADWRALEEEAVRQHSSLEGVLEHATMLFLADLDDGRASVRPADEPTQD